jgi:Holliday junction resolvase RusA-like endonuclease
VTLSFTIPGVPVAKARARHIPLMQCKQCGRKGVQRVCRCGSQDMNYLTSIPMTETETKRYENQVSSIARETLLAAGSETLLVGALTLTARFYFLIPQGRRLPPESKSKMALREGDAHTQKPDLDNCFKSLLDGLNKVIIADDAQIHRLTGEKFWSLMPRAEVEITGG